MALPTSPPITLRQIATEFQAGGVVSLRDFYRGGGLVPNIPQNSNIPTSGTISLLDFLGASNYIPLDGNRSPITGTVSLTAPPFPPSTTVTAAGTAGATGGTGSYTYAWSIRSGNANISGSTTGANVTLTALVPRDSQVTGTVRVTISDGVSSVNIDRPYVLEYYTLA